jgi:xylose isomerase
MHEVKPASFIYEISGTLPGDVCRDKVRRFEADLEQQFAGHIGRVSTEAASIKKTTGLLDLFRRAPSAEPCSP